MSRRAATCLALLLLAGCSSGTSDPADEEETATTDAPADAPSVLTVRPVTEVLAAEACDEQADDLVAEERDGTVTACLRLGPPPTDKVDVESAEAVLDATGTTWTVALELTDDEGGIGAFNALAERCFAAAPECPTSRVAVLVDRELVTAPTVAQASFEPDQIQISATFTEAEAEALADALA